MDVAGASVDVPEKSGNLITALVPSIRKTAELGKELASASGEQASGVSQISKAMQQVEQVTQRNAAAAEELASTAEELSRQAASLNQLLNFFRSGDQHSFSASIPPTPPHLHPQAPPNGSNEDPGMGANKVVARNDFQPF